MSVLLSSQSLEGSIMKMSKEQIQRLVLQRSSADQIPTISHEKKGGFDWDLVETMSGEGKTFWPGFFKASPPKYTEKIKIK